VTYARESDWLFNGYSAAGGSDREIAFPVDEARGMNNILSISFVLTMINEGKRGTFVKSGTAMKRANGLSNDIQGGLKVWKRSIISENRGPMEKCFRQKL